MKLFSQPLPSGKWGIYSDAGLLATVDSQVICETIMANLATGRRDAPFDDVNALYQVPELRKKTDQSAGSGTHFVPSARQSTQSTSVTASQGNQLAGNHLESKGADAETLTSSQVSAQSSVTQKAADQKTGKTAKKRTVTEPLKGRAKARANGSAKRKRRSTRPKDASLAS